MPPILGVTFLCIFLPPGASKIFLPKTTRIISGIEKITPKNEAITNKIIDKI